jgi:small subunit ribosomal protein S2
MSAFFSGSLIELEKKPRIMIYQKMLKKNTNWNLPAFLGEKICHPSMSFSVVGGRPDFQMINPEISFISLYQVLEFLRDFVSNTRGNILFLNTNPEFDTLNCLTALQCNQRYVNNKWVGGTLTNWKQVSKAIERYVADAEGQRRSFEKLKKLFEGFDPREAKRHLKNQKLKLVFMKKSFQECQLESRQLITGRRQLMTLMPLTSGTHVLKPESSVPLLKNQMKRTSLLIVLNPDANNRAIKEAAFLKIPVIAFVTSETNREGITYPIVGNNKNLSFLFFSLNWIAKILNNTTPIDTRL